MTYIDKLAKKKSKTPVGSRVLIIASRECYIATIIDNQHISSLAQLFKPWIKYCGTSCYGRNPQGPLLTERLFFPQMHPKPQHPTPRPQLPNPNHGVALLLNPQPSRSCWGAARTASYSSAAYSWKKQRRTRRKLRFTSYTFAPRVFNAVVVLWRHSYQIQQ